MTDQPNPYGLIGTGPPVLQAEITGVVQEVGRSFDRLAAIVSDVIAAAAKGAGRAGVSIPEADAHVVRSAVQGIVQTGDSLVLGIRAIVVGVLRGTQEREHAAVRTLARTARTVTSHTAGLNGDLKASTEGLMQGARESAEGLGVNRRKAAAAAAHGARLGAQDAGPAAVAAVHDALAETIP